MITSLCALVLLAPPPEGQWAPTTLTPLDLARRVDTRLATLSNAMLNYRFTYIDQKVGSGYADCEGSIFSPTTFRVQVPVVDTRRRNVLDRETWIADGKRFASRMASEASDPVPLAKRTAPPARPAAAFYENPSLVLFSGLGRATHPLEGVLKDASRLGLQPKAETRWLRFQGHQIVSYRIVLDNPKVRYELVIDGKGFLPVSITNSRGLSDSVRWSGVRWNLRPGKALDRSVITFRKPAGVVPLSGTPRRP